MDPQYGILSMPGTGILVIGFLAGYVAEKTMNRDHGFFTNILVAIAGAVLVLWIFGRSQTAGSR